MTAIFRKLVYTWQIIPKKIKRVMIVLISIILLGSLVTCDAFKGEKIDWVNVRLGEVIPKPQSNRMKIWSNSDKELDVEIYNISANQYYEYIRWCEDEKGFTVDIESYSSSFCAYNQDGYFIDLFYTDYNETLKIRLDCPMEMGVFSLPEYATKAGLPEPQSALGCYNWKYVVIFSCCR